MGFTVNIGISNNNITENNINILSQDVL